MKTIIVWYRNDLRLHDHPALHQAAQEADYVVPLFIFDRAIYEGKHASSNRNRFLLECLEDLKGSLKKAGADLVVRKGRAEEILRELANETNAGAVYYAADYTPYAVRRDKRVENALGSAGIQARAFPGRLIVSTVGKITTKQGTPHKVFTPFYRSWLAVGRRAIVDAPVKLSLPNGLRAGTLPPLGSISLKGELSTDAMKGGETAALERFGNFLNGLIHEYHKTNNDMSLDGTSRLSAYLHFGCLSPGYAESQLSGSQGSAAWRRQLAWRDFYHYTLFHNPGNSMHEFQLKYRGMKWGDDKELLKAWQEGMTGYPVVDAAMRQLRREGWMHNRARLVVGSFLTKDLWLDWRLGEAHFMSYLLDGDQSNNNGNWQWIASVGVDPAPVYRRLYSPTSQREKYDPRGRYVRRYVPELKHVPDKYLSDPWTMPEAMQKETGCVIGRDYPAPIVDHGTARQAALERYRSVKPV